MTTTTRTASWVGLLLTAALGMSGCSGSADATSDGTGSAPASPGHGPTLFSDPFDDDHNGWALPDNALINFDFGAGDFRWESKRQAADNRPHLSAAPLGDAFDSGNPPQMRNVVVRTTFTTVRGAGAMGVFCRDVRDTDADFQWYEFVARDGYAAIRRSDSSGHLDVLAKTSKVNLPLGDKATLEGACVDDAKGHARLWLSINGDPVLYATDAHPLGNGAPGLQVYDSPDDAASARYLVRWHDFAVYRPAV